MSTRTKEPQEKQRRGMPNAHSLSTIAAVILCVASFGGGAIRYQGGVLEALGLKFMSYGHGAGISNVTLWCGVVLLTGSWVLMGREVLSARSAHGDAAALVPRITKTLAIMGAILLFAAPMMSRDVYSYLMQGALLGGGFDPYTQGASYLSGPHLMEVSHDWRNTTTPYGPLHLWIGMAVTTIAGENITLGILAYKVLSLLGFAGIVFAVPKIAERLGSDPGLALWLGVANPVMVIHLIAGMHNESMMVALVSLGLLLALRNKTYAGFALISVAVALKATAAFILPFVVWIAVAGAGEKKAERIKAFLWYAFSGVLILVAVLAAITFFSGASWGWITQLTGNSKVINPLAFPSLIAGGMSAVAGVWTDSFPYNEVLALLRTASMIVMGLGMIACWWLFRSSKLQAVRGAIGAYCFAFVFNAVTLPWYYASILSLVGCVRPSERAQKITVAASVIVALAFTGSGNHQLYNPVWMATATVFAWLCVQWLYHDRSPAQALSTSGARV